MGSLAICPGVSFVWKRVDDIPSPVGHAVQGGIDWRPRGRRRLARWAGNQRRAGIVYLNSVFISSYPSSASTCIATPPPVLILLRSFIDTCCRSVVQSRSHVEDARHTVMFCTKLRAVREAMRAQLEPAAEKLIAQTGLGWFLKLLDKIKMSNWSRLVSKFAG